MEYPQRTTTLSTEAVGDGLAVFHRERGESYVLNATSALVFEHCDGQTSPGRLRELLQRKFALPAGEAEEVLQLALEELRAADLLEPSSVPIPALAAAVTRRQAIAALGGAGLSMVLLPIVARVAEAQGGHTLVPLLECVDNNGDGTYTAHFGYLNQGYDVIELPVGAKNMFVGGDADRGQPTVFLPGEHLSEFSVTFGALESIKWLLKADGDRRHQVEASALSEACVVTTTDPGTTGN